MLFDGGPVGDFWNSMIDKDIDAHGMAPGNIVLSVDADPFPKGTRGEYRVTMSGDKDFPYAAEVSIYDRSYKVVATGEDSGMTPHEAIANALDAAGAYKESERVPGGEMMLRSMGDED